MLLERLRQLGLRTRLSLAFLAVSVPPVLFGSAIAVGAISEAFSAYIDGWLDETAVYLANDLLDSQNEAARVVRVVAGHWTASPPRFGESDQLRTDLVSELVRSVGYDLVVVYRPGGQVLAHSGDILNLTLPSGAGSFVAFTQASGASNLVVGATAEMGGAAGAPLLMIADAVNDRYSSLRQGILSLDVRIHRWTGTEFIEAAPSTDGARPDEALSNQFREGRRSYTLHGPNGTSVAFAAIRTGDGNMIGLVSCQLARPLVLFLQSWRARLFAALTAVSAALSILVGVTVATRLARPVQALIGGMRAVTQGDYSQRVPEEGGRELAELGRGFNGLTERLEQLRRVEEELIRQRQLASLGEAAAVIAHEIRNPLGIIKTSADLLRSRAQLAPADLTLLDYVRDEVDRIGRLVREMLAAVTPGMVQMAPCDLTALVRDLAGFLQASLEANRIALTLDPLEPVTMQADGDKLREMLLNLALNAIDAIPKGGQLRIGVESIAGPSVRLTVADNGCGMPPDISARIFDPFFTTKARGSGLGLARARAIVTQHGGTIDCASEVGRGSVFTVVLPLHTA